LRIGIALATPTGNRADLDDIDTINVSGDEMSSDEIIPTVISYSPASENRERSWGPSLGSNAVAVAHPMYLELDLHDSGESDLILEALSVMHNLDFRAPPYPWESPEEMFENFLTNVFDAFLEGMTRRFDEGFPQELSLRNGLPVDIVVTSPAVRLRMQH
jgi:hypothetical protein